MMKNELKLKTKETKKDIWLLTPYLKQDKKVPKTKWHPSPTFPMFTRVSQNLTKLSQTFKLYTQSEVKSGVMSAGLV